MYSLKLATLLLFILWFRTTSGANKIQLPPVTVLKCCRIGERLKEENSTLYCEPGASRQWTPTIYAPRKRTYLQSGTIPPHWTINETHPQCPNHLRPTFLRGLSSTFTLFVNGSLYLHENHSMLSPQSFCVDSATDAIACLEMYSDDQSNITTKLIKVKKCCGESAAYSDATQSCIEARNGSELQAEDIKIYKRDEEFNNATVKLTRGFPSCSSPQSGMVIAGNLKDAALEMDGALQVSSAGIRLAQDQFCVEIIAEHNEARVFACSESVPDAPMGEMGYDLRLTLYPLGLLISTIFLVATLAAAFLLRSTHHALHWRCQMHYIGCLLIGDFLLAIVQLAGTSISGTPCIMIAVMIHFFFLAAFFWLNTMCFNIWWTFRDFRPTTLEKRQEVCRLRFYEVFAWGIPLLIAGIALVLDRLPPDPQQTFLRPRYGVKRCWFYGDLEILTFFFGPIGVLLGVNLLLFASTARQLTCGLWKREDVKSTTERAALGRVCMKLVVVMGVTWIADVVSWAVGGPSYLWYMTDLINALQGVLIFIVVGCQPQVWAAVKKMWCLKLFRSNATNTTGAQMHSSSQGLPSMGDSVTNNTIANTNTSIKIPMETVC